MTNDVIVDISNRTMPLNMAITKPVYLITLEVTGKIKKDQYFISLDRPELLEGFIQVKGFFVEKSKDEIINNFGEILTTVKKELILEMMFPCHKICSIRNLIFRSNKK